MILIGVLNVSIGYCTYDPQPTHEFERIQLQLLDAGVADSVPAVDAR